MCTMYASFSLYLSCSLPPLPPSLPPSLSPWIDVALAREGERVGLGRAVAPSTAAGRATTDAPSPPPTA